MASIVLTITWHILQESPGQRAGGTAHNQTDNDGVAKWGRTKGRADLLRLEAIYDILNDIASILPDKHVALQSSS